MKPIITVDIETYSPQDIKTVGAYRYAQDPEFQILLLGYALADNDPTVIDLTSWPDTKHFLREQLPWLLDDSYTKRAHNAAFEWWCLSEAMGLSWEQRVLWLQQWECSLVHALYCGLPAQLGALGAALKQPEDALKMKEGKALIKYFCTPCKPTKVNGGRTRNLPHHDAAKWKLFCKYNGMDVIAERANDRKLAPWPVPEEIMQQICKICLPGGRILDPFAGSGSTLAAAELEGYDSVGVELSEEIAKSAAQRLSVPRKKVGD